MQLFVQHERRIYGFILSLVHNWNDTDDLLQETMAVMWQKFDQFQADADFGSWGISIARYRVMDYRRKQKVRSAAYSDRTLEMVADQMVSLVEQDDVRTDALHACMQKLRDRDRELIQLRYQGESSVQEVAQAVDRSADSVYKSLNRIHGQLLLCIRKELAGESSK